MIDKEIFWFPSGVGKILRFFSCDSTGSILYSWKHNKSSKLQSLTFIRHFNSASNVDEIVFACDGIAEIVHASLSADHQAVALSVCYQRDQTTSDEAVFKVVTDLTQDYVTELNDIHPMVSNDSSSISSKTPVENLIPNSDIGSCPSPLNFKKALYKSFIAQTYPTGWCMQFCGRNLNLDEVQETKLAVSDERLQKPVFTNFSRFRETRDIKLTEYGVILTTFRHYVGLYSFLLQDEASSSTLTDPQVAGKKFTLQHKSHRSRIYGKPESEVLAEKIVWSQWDRFLQRLYYLVPKHKRNQKLSETSKTIYLLSCVQFFHDAQRQQVFEIEVDLDIPLPHDNQLAKKPTEFDPTVSSRDLNMRLCVMHESGLLCLCWQETPSVENVPELAYSIVVLNKAIVIKRKFCRGNSLRAISFFALGHLLVVHCPGSYIHLYDVDHLNSDFVQMDTGLYHMSLNESSYPHLVGTSLQYIMPNQMPDVSGYLDDNMSWSSNDSLDSTLADVRRQNSICYDADSKSFFTVFIDCDQFTKLFFSRNLTLQNRIFLARQAVWMSRYDDSSEKWIASVVRFVSKDPTDPGVTVVLSQLFIAFTYLNLLEPTVGVPSLLLGLFPVTLPASVLHKFITLKERESDGSSFGPVGNQLNLKSEIKSFVTSLLYNEWNPASFHVSDNDDVINERVSTAWIRSKNACESSVYVPYNLDCIRHQLDNLEATYPHPGIITQKRSFNQHTVFQKRLSKKLRRYDSSGDTASSSRDPSSSTASSSRDELLRSLDQCPRTWREFLDQSEKNVKSDNLLVLTYTKLCDHLLAHCRQAEPEDLQLIAQNYVHAQIQAAYRVLSLIMFKFGVNNLDKPLYVRASSSDQNRYFALNQFQLVCEVTCFPLPNGFHTLITCLTFRSLLARYPGSADAGVLAGDNIDRFSECFFGQVDRKLIQLTDAFVEKVLGDLGDREAFGSIVEEVLRRTRFESGDNVAQVESLARWRNPKSELLLTKAFLKELYKHEVKDDKISSSNCFGKQRAYSTESAPQQLNVDRLREGSNPPQLRTRSGTFDERLPDRKESSTVGFPPFDAFSDFVREREESLRDEDRFVSAELVEKTVIQQVGRYSC